TRQCLSNKIKPRQSALLHSSTHSPPTFNSTLTASASLGIALNLLTHLLSSPHFISSHQHGVHVHDLSRLRHPRSHLLDLHEHHLPQLPARTRSSHSLRRTVSRHAVSITRHHTIV